MKSEWRSSSKQSEAEYREIQGKGRSLSRFCTFCVEAKRTLCEVRPPIHNPLLHTLGLLWVAESKLQWSSSLRLGRGSFLPLRNTINQRWISIHSLLRARKYTWVFFPNSLLTGAHLLRYWVPVTQCVCIYFSFTYANNLQLSPF